VDLNRAGMPLLEIVSEPDIRSAEEAREYMEQLRLILKYLDVCDGNLEEGSMRCDANISIRLRGEEKYGTRVEIKNLNSFRALTRAIEYEYERHIDTLEAGGKLVQETRLWDDNKGITSSMRSKEEALDYRYFPDPDLMPLEISEEWIEKVRATLPEVPSQKFERYTVLGLSEYDANVIINQMDISIFFDEALKLGANPKAAANFLMGEVSAYLKEEKFTLPETKLTPQNFQSLLGLIEAGTISNNIAKALVVDLLKDGVDPKTLVEQKGLSVLSDEGDIIKIIQKILSENPNELAQYRAGKDKLFGFFVGQTMKATQGRANPKVLNELLKKELDK
jgi:aspartyl-tRNA(Asn)/glutamyl-tRNA(Gln) amidotransferase subunit B